MSTINRRRRSILKSSRNSIVNGILDDSSNSSGTLVYNANKRVSFGHKEIKEFQLNLSNEQSPQPTFLGSEYGENGDKTLFSTSSMDLTFGKALMNVSYRDVSVRQNGQSSQRSLSCNGTQEDRNSKNYAQDSNKTVLGEVDMDFSLSSEGENENESPASTAMNTTFLMGIDPPGDESQDSENSGVDVSSEPNFDLSRIIPSLLNTNRKDSPAPPVCRLPNPTCVLTPRSMMTRSTAKLMSKQMNLLSPDVDLPTASSSRKGLFMKIPKQSTFKVKSNEFRNKKTNKQPVGSIFHLSVKTPKRRLNREMAVPLSNCPTTTTLTTEGPQQCPPLELVQKLPEAPKILSNATSQTDGLPVPPAVQFTSNNFEQNAPPRFLITTEVGTQFSPQNIEKGPVQIVPSQTIERGLAQIVSSQKIDKGPVQIVSSQRVEMGSGQMVSLQNMGGGTVQMVSSQRIEDNPVQMVSSQNIEKGPVQIAPSQRMERGPIHLVSSQNIEKGPVQIFPSQTIERGPVQIVSLTACLSLQSEKPKLPPHMVKEYESESHRSDLETCVSSNVSWQACNSSNTGPLPQFTVGDPNFEETSYHKTFNQSEELLEHQQRPFLETSCDELDETLNENPLHVSQNVFNYVRHYTELDLDKRLQSMENVMPEIIAMTDEVYPQFKTLYLKCFRQQYWQAVEIHRRVEKVLGRYPLPLADSPKTTKNN